MFVAGWKEQSRPAMHTRSACADALPLGLRAHRIPHPRRGQGRHQGRQRRRAPRAEDHGRIRFRAAPARHQGTSPRPRPPTKRARRYQGEESQPRPRWRGSGRLKLRTTHRIRCAIDLGWLRAVLGAMEQDGRYDESHEVANQPAVP
jgi:hypothetical protein